MHRFQVVCRVVRAGLRSEKIRNNELPVATGEEVRRNHESNSNNEKFAKPKHTPSECMAITAGLVVSWDLFHRFCGPAGVAGGKIIVPEIKEESSSSGRQSITETSTTHNKPECPYKFKSRQAYAQPLQQLLEQALLPTTTSVSYVNPSKAAKSEPKSINNKAGDAGKATSLALGKPPSIDRGVFLPEEWSDVESSFALTDSEDDSLVFFEGDSAKSNFTAGSKTTTFNNNKINKPSHPEPKITAFAEKIAGNVLGVQAGLQYFLDIQNPPVSAQELLKRSSKLGSGRSMYNLGVMYWEEKEFQEAEECFKGAADRGHPLGCYNYAAMILHKEKKITEEVKLLMSYASDHGVPEAKPYVVFAKK